MSWTSRNFTFSLENWKFHDFLLFYILKDFNENALSLKKKAHGAQDHPKCIVFHWFKQHSRQPAARVRKHNFLKKWQTFSALSTDESSIKIMEFPWISWFSTCQNIKYFLRNTWYFLRYPTNFWGILPIPASKHEILHIFRFYGPKAHFRVQKWTSAPPAQNIL